MGNCPEAKRHEAASTAWSRHKLALPGRQGATAPRDARKTPTRGLCGVPSRQGVQRGPLWPRRKAATTPGFPGLLPSPHPSNSGPDLRSPSPRPRQHGPPFSPRALLALTRSMWEKPVSTRFLRSSQPMPPAPTTSTRPPATASASSRGNPRDSAMAGRPRAAAEAEAREMSRGRKQVGEGRRSFRSCALRPPFGAERATPATCGAHYLGQGSALRQETSHTCRCAPARSCIS